MVANFIRCIDISVSVFMISPPSPPWFLSQHHLFDYREIDYHVIYAIRLRIPCVSAIVFTALTMLTFFVIQF